MPHTAERFSGKLLDRIEQLVGLSEMGIVPQDEYLQARGYRVPFEGGHLFFV
jgi:hypothetical protein